MRYLEEWLARDTSYYIEVASIVQVDLEQHIRVPYNSSMKEVRMQQMEVERRIFQQPRIKLDEEINEIWMLMERVSKQRYCRRKKAFHNTVYFTAKVYISQNKGRLKFKVWKPRETKASKIDEEEQ